MSWPEYQKDLARAASESWVLGRAAEILTRRAEEQYLRAPRWKQKLMWLIASHTSTWKTWSAARVCWKESKS